MRLLLMLSLTIAVLGPTPALAVQLFDFDGQAVDAAFVGDTLTMVSRMTNGEVLPSPLPLDNANFEYTVVVTGLRLDTVGSVDMFSGGTVTIYEDDATVADYADMSSFMDGTAILVGDLATFTRQMFTATLGAGAGNVDWTGGTHIGDLHPIDRDTWPFLVNVSRSATVVEAGYTERWDGKVEPQEDVVATESMSLGGVKASY